jgi:AraC-like DNA-binding protein
MNKRLPGEIFTMLPEANTSSRLVKLRPYLRQSGNQVRQRWRIRKRKLLDYMLVYIISGKGRFYVDGKGFSVGPGSITWVPPDTGHEMSGNDDMHLIYLHFDLVYDPERSHWNASLPGGTLDLSDYQDKMHPPVDDPVISQWCGLLDVGEPQKLYPLMRQICLEHRRQTSCELALSGLLLQLIAALCTAVDKGENTVGADARIRKAMIWLRNHDEQPFDLRKAARQAGLSAPHFRKLFREAYGVSPRGFHQRCRIARAGELLIYSDRTVSEAAELLGYGSIYSFSRAFKQVTGISPQKFKSGRPGPSILS